MYCHVNEHRLAVADSMFLFIKRNPVAFFLQTPGPAAYKKPETEIYKKRSPKYSMGTRSKIHGSYKGTPGPADYELGKVRNSFLVF